MLYLAPFTGRVLASSARRRKAPMNATRCDLHLHSAASIGNDEWYTRVFGCPESYAEPRQQYDLCKARGMTLSLIHI